MKTLLILVDGMRADAVEQVVQAKNVLQASEYTLAAQTVMPSSTLPCHMSMFHSVEPSRHGTATNTYAPQVRPIDGLFEVLAAAKKTTALFYSWGPLRDVARPKSVDFSYYVKGDTTNYVRANELVTDAAISCVQDFAPDFAFLYLGLTDEAGHAHGWMSDKYFDSLNSSFENIERILATLPEDYAVIILADHGGHDRCHGTDLPEDMTIPMLVLRRGNAFSLDLSQASIMDVAPTITALLGVEPNGEWEGKSLVG